MAQLAHAFDFNECIEEALDYHDPNRPGFVSVMEKQADGQMRQSSFKLVDLPGRLVQLRESGRDAFIGQNEFWKPNRQAINVWRMTTQFVDLDTYNVPDLAWRLPETQRDMLLQFIDDEGLPPPSVILFSGRGLQVKWHLAGALPPRRAVPRWQVVQDELCRRFTKFGSDIKARDVSRVLRVAGTVNTKSGELVRILYRGNVCAMGGERMANGGVGYDFDLLANEVLPCSRVELAANAESRVRLQEEGEAESARRRDAVRERLAVVDGGNSATRKKSSSAKGLVATQLAWDRLEDLRSLSELRGWTSTGAPAGRRDMMMFLSACFLADSRLCIDINPQLKSLASEFAPTWTVAELASCTSTALSRAAAAERGEKVLFGGAEVCPRYRFKNSTLVNLLDISPYEQRQLQTIFGPDEVRRRDRERKARQRLEAGCESREAYLARAAEAAIKARSLKANGFTRSQIAAALGVSLAAVTGYCKG
ncbi:hypothetical protein [Roseateles albus]|uniref:Replication protein n=1 Tax=Roseateles albus TaxID=2987525 RepID=A0ABT5KCR8_9BURK|nr:hypothetical protein [Roseateles albus]MDC8771725.1 hypothetical protein [Roseateles albus]